ncbi:ribbon-helix-helix protein, CopG family [Candidatus Dependentiae bacterium]|nr:ribbon-helix-helix protein, CopG family [Candidatus Dependentiae bacterium]
MAKALIEIPDEIIEKLDLIAKKRRSSRSSLIRTAITMWIEEQKNFSKQEAFGILKNKEPEDGIKFQRKIRGEWK